MLGEHGADIGGEFEHWRVSVSIARSRPGKTAKTAANRAIENAASRPWLQAICYRGSVKHPPRQSATVKLENAGHLYDTFDLSGQHPAKIFISRIEREGS
jgi:hypothetical protein